MAVKGFWRWLLMVDVLEDAFRDGQRHLKQTGDMVRGAMSAAESRPQMNTGTSWGTEWTEAQILRLRRNMRVAFIVWGLMGAIGLVFLLGALMLTWPATLPRINAFLFGLFATLISTPRYLAVARDLEMLKKIQMEKRDDKTDS